MAWAKGGSRRRPLPADWSRRRAAVLRRDPVCRLCGKRPSTEVDHRDAEGSDTLSNLQGACTPCHKAKTHAESLQARGHGALRRRPEEKHPGIR
jgi:5-methylcytosine-specific restriction protein A